MINPIRYNLKNNLWNLIDNKPVEIFNFIEYLEAVLIRTQRKIVAHDFSFLLRYRNQFQKYYVEVLDYLNREFYNGEVMKLEKIINKQVNGSFTSVLENFLTEYDEAY